MKKQMIEKLTWLAIATLFVAGCAAHSGGALVTAHPNANGTIQPRVCADPAPGEARCH